MVEYIGICDLTRALCNSHLETCTHLFLHYKFANKIWVAVISWLGYAFVHPNNPENLSKSKESD